MLLYFVLAEKEIGRREARESTPDRPVDDGLNPPRLQGGPVGDHCTWITGILPYVQRKLLR